MVEFFDPIRKENISYHIDAKLKAYLDKHVKIDLEKKDKDYVALIDGYEGAGKSTFGQQIGKYVDPTLDLGRICMTSSEFRDAVINAQKNQCVIYDEAVTGMTAADSISRVGKLLKSLMMQMRQKNLFVIVILPSVFEMNKYTILSRAKAFFHIYELKGRRGYFVGYNRRDMRKLYLNGKKTYSYTVHSRFRGRFYGKYAIDEASYRDKKEKILETLDDDEETEHHRWVRQRNVCLKLLSDQGLSYRKIIELLNAESVRMSMGNLSRILGPTLDAP